MSATEKSDLPEVAKKRSNKAASAAAETAERRGRAKENAELQNTVRTQSREAVSRAQARIREAVTRNKQAKLTALLHHLNIDVLRASYFGLKKTAAPGIDEMTWADYVKDLEANLADLHNRVHTGAYRALPSRRTYIPKADGRQRPLGIASLEDKIVQAAVVAISAFRHHMLGVGFSLPFDAPVDCDFPCERDAGGPCDGAAPCRRRGVRRRIELVRCGRCNGASVRARLSIVVEASRTWAASNGSAAKIPPWPMPADASTRPPPRTKLPRRGMIRCDQGVGALSRAR